MKMDAKSDKLKDGSKVQVSGTSIKAPEKAKTTLIAFEVCLIIQHTVYLRRHLELHLKVHLKIYIKMRRKVLLRLNKKIHLLWHLSSTCSCITVNAYDCTKWFSKMKNLGQNSMLHLKTYLRFHFSEHLKLHKMFKRKIYLMMKLMVHLLVQFRVHLSVH